MTIQHADGLARLTAHLQQCGKTEIRMTFSEIEDLLKQPFPASARKYAAWWSNNASNNPRTYGWLNAGYRSRNVNVAAETVVFEKST